MNLALPSFALRATPVLVAGLLGIGGGQRP